MTPDPEQIMQLISALTTVADVLGRIGPGGVIVLLVGGPAVVLLAVLVIDFLRGRQMLSMVETMRAENRKVMDGYRRETQMLLRELGGNQAQTDQYYRDNIVLVQQYERLASDLVAVVTCNTKASERLCVMIEAQGGCHK